MKVLITGADGFIGSHLTEELVRRGHSIRALVQYNSFNSWGWLDDCPSDIAGHFDVISGDIRDEGQVHSIMRGCDSVLHLAALIAIPYSYAAPSSYVQTNIFGTLNVLQAAKNLGIRRLIHTSTSEVYGSARFVPITEEHPLQGQSPYSASKIAADQLAYSFHKSFDLPVLIARPFNTYGPRQSARAVIPTIISQISNGAEFISLGSLHPTRDFNYVGDTVSAYIKMLESDIGLGEVFNVGSNFEISIGDTVNLIAKIMSKNIEVRLDAKRVRPKISEVERLYSSNEKLKRVFGWLPQYGGLSGFEIGLAKTIDWFNNPAHLKKYRPEAYVI